MGVATCARRDEPFSLLARAEILARSSFYHFLFKPRPRSPARTPRISSASPLKAVAEMAPRPLSISTMLCSNQRTAASDQQRVPGKRHGGSQAGGRRLSSGC